MKLALLVFASMAVTGSLCATVHAQTLTDITLFRLDANNNTVNEGWNTRDNDFISNLYLLSGGNFVNAGATIALDLSAPGTYTFAFAGENVNANTATSLGINFFFGGNSTTPGISARGTAVINNAGGFVASGGSTNAPNYSNIAGANTLTYFSNGNSVTLSALTYNTSTGADQVTSYTNTPGGTADTVGSFTLTVARTSAPEPSALALIAPALLGAAWCRRRRQHAGSR